MMLTPLSEVNRQKQTPGQRRALKNVAVLEAQR